MYTQEVKLNDNEVVVKVNAETGEVKEVAKRPNNIPEGKELFEPNAQFAKHYSKSWAFLESQLTALEFKAAYRLAMRAKAFTNSLEPINDNTAIPELMEVLAVSKNIVRRVIDKLFYLGVYGKFSIVEADKPYYTKYWILNPYLSFNGKIIHSGMTDMFKGTKVAQAFRGEI